MKMFHVERLSALVSMLALVSTAVPQPKTPQIKSHKVGSPEFSCQTYYTLPRIYPEYYSPEYVPVTERHQPPPAMHKYSKSDPPDFKRVPPHKTWELEIRGYGSCDFKKTKPQPPPWFKVSKIDVKSPNLAVVTVDASGK